MTRDDIIKLAREAGTQHVGHGGLFVPDSFSLRFAALVAAAEREECARVCDDLGDGFPLGSDELHITKSLARDIRARGET